MIGLLQRVVEAAVHVGADQVACIGPGLLVLVGVRPMRIDFGPAPGADPLGRNRQE